MLSLNELLIKELSKVSQYSDYFLEKKKIIDNESNTSSDESEIVISKDIILDFLTKSGYEFTQANFDMAEKYLRSLEKQKLSTTLQNAGKMPDIRYNTINHLHDLSSEELNSLLFLDILNNLLSINNNLTKKKEYTYSVVTIKDGFGGSTKQFEMQQALNKYAKNGYRLVSSFTNELGKRSTTIANCNINSTVDEIILIFEKEVDNE